MKIAVITGSRADWNALGMVAKAMAADQRFQVDVIATGQHCETEKSLVTIRQDGFAPWLVPLSRMGDSVADIAEATGWACARVGGVLDTVKPDLVLLGGDRYETHGAATAAALMGIPIAHLSGGDVTEGSVDNKLRDSITALSQVHFPTNQDSAARIVASGHALDRVHMVGEPALDRIRTTATLSKIETFCNIRLNESDINVLVAFHPATNAVDPKAECDAMIAVLADFSRENAEVSFLFLSTNADAGSDHVRRSFIEFCRSRKNARLADNLSPQLYYSALAHFDVLVGNSSAGLYEAPSFGLPVVNIGDRQKGRIAAANVRTCAPTREGIHYSVRMARAEGRKPCLNPYGDGCSAPRIVKVLGDIENPKSLLRRA